MFRFKATIIVAAVIAAAITCTAAQAVTPVYPGGINPGNTTAEVNANFAKYMKANFSAKAIESGLLHKMTKQDLCLFRTLYASPSYPSQKTLADGLVTTYANATDKQRYWVACYTYPVGAAQRAAAHPPHSMAASGLALPNPTLDMTIEEVYLDFLTSDLTVTAAVTGATLYTASNVGVAWQAGYDVGTIISNLIETLDPDLNDDIGAAIAAAADALAAAGDEVLQAAATDQVNDSIFPSPTDDFGGDDGNDLGFDDYAE
jgi:hypothetical protein